MAVANQKAAGRDALVPRLTAAVRQLKKERDVLHAELRRVVADLRRAAQEVEKAGAHEGQGEGAQALHAHLESVGSAFEEITDVTDLIGGVARQTHMLSLNAAVEAARAGRRGRGFAVVAQEVQRLAGKSADAARSATDITSRARTAVERCQEASAQLSTGERTPDSDSGASLRRAADRLEGLLAPESAPRPAPPASVVALAPAPADPDAWAHDDETPEMHVTSSAVQPVDVLPLDDDERGYADF